MKLFCRVHQIKGIDGSSLELSVYSFPKGEEIRCDCSDSPVTCYKVFKFDIDEQVVDDGELRFTLKKKRIFGAPKIIAVLTLPLRWFSVDKTTRSTYPMNQTTPGLEELIADVEIHLSTDSNIRPFDAPSGKLLVQPQWETGGTSIKAIPTTPAVMVPQTTEYLQIQENSPVPQPAYAPQHTAYIPSSQPQFPVDQITPQVPATTIDPYSAPADPYSPQVQRTTPYDNPYAM